MAGEEYNAMKSLNIFRLLPLLLVATLLVCSTAAIRAEKPSGSSPKIQYTVLSTIERMKAEGVTATNARLPGIRSKFNTMLSHIDDQGRLGVLLDVKEVTPELLAALKGLGSEISLAIPEAKLISVFVPIGNIESVAALEAVRIVRPMTGGAISVGSKTTEGDSLLHAINVRRDLNVKGDSIKVGVISDGCPSWAASQASGDLPASFGPTHFTFANGNKKGSGDEGTAMMEIVYDIAPKADLYFYGALRDSFGFFRTSADMVDAIQRLVREKGCQVIVDDLTWFDQPMFEDNTVATSGMVAAAARWATDTGVVYISSAGNYADGPPHLIDRTHHMDTFRDVNPGSNASGKPLPNGPGPPAPIFFGYAPPFDNLHNFNSAGAPTDPGLLVRIPPATRLTVILEWGDPSGISPDPWGGTGDDYDLYLYDATFVSKLAWSITPQVGAQNPYEALSLENPFSRDSMVNIVINHMPSMAPPKQLTLYLSGCSWVEYFTAQQSIWGQPGVTSVIAVGAVPYSNIAVNESYSSQGTYEIFVPAIEHRSKPDVVSVDGCLITGAGGFGSPDGLNMRFWGTSAAAPHVAGMAALLLSRCPAMTPAEVKAKLERTAVPLGNAIIFGNGRADIERAMLEVNPAIAVSGPYTMSVAGVSPMFFATPDGYAMNTVKITAGASPPTTVASAAHVTAGNPYSDAGTIDLGCPTIGRWYDLVQTGGTDGQFNADVTAYIDESERAAVGLPMTSFKLVHWNGAYFVDYPAAVAPDQVGNTWRFKASVPNASFSPYFLANYTRGIAAQKVADMGGQKNDTVDMKFTVQNTGTGWDTLSVLAGDSLLWGATTQKPDFSLGAGVTDTVVVEVIIPSGATVGTVDTIAITVTSVSDPTVFASCFARLTVGDAMITKSCYYVDRWNMVSVPLRMEEWRKDSLFPGNVSSAFAYDSTGYVTKDTLANGAGYWMKFSGVHTISFYGLPRPKDSVQVRQGWNMVGTLADTIPTRTISSNPPMTTSQFFGYNQGYVSDTLLIPGKAYWVKVSQAGWLIFSSSGIMPPAISIRAISEMPPPPPREEAAGEKAGRAVPVQFSLGQNYPNPFNPATTINYALPEGCYVTLKVYNTLGEEVAAPVNGMQAAGYRSVTLDAGALPSGIYIYRLTAGSFTLVRKMVLLR